MSKAIPILPPPYLSANDKARFSELAETLAASLNDLDADLLAKYVIAENEYLVVTKNVLDALKNGDADSAKTWIAVQENLVRQCTRLSDELGISPNARRTRGTIIQKRK